MTLDYVAMSNRYWATDTIAAKKATVTKPKIATDTAVKQQLWYCNN